MSESPEEVLAQQKANCIFCKIISKQVPGLTVYEDEEFIAIMDIRPATKGHVLVMPKEHYPILPVIPQNLLPKLFLVSRKIAVAVKSATNSEEASIFIANGGPAGQQSPHFILHVFPRKSDDGIRTNMPEVASIPEITDQLNTSLQKAFISIFPKEISRQIPLEEVTAELDPIDQIAIGLEQNPEVKEMIKTNPEGFKQMLESNPQLKSVFDKIDLNVLSKKLNDLDSKDSKSDLDKIERLFK